MSTKTWRTEYSRSTWSSWWQWREEKWAIPRIHEGKHIPAEAIMKDSSEIVTLLRQKCSYLSTWFKGNRIKGCCGGKYLQHCHNIPQAPVNVARSMIYTLQHNTKHEHAKFLRLQRNSIITLRRLTIVCQFQQIQNKHDNIEQEHIPSSMFSLATIQLKGKQPESLMLSNWKSILVVVGGMWNGWDHISWSCTSHQCQRSGCWLRF